MVTQRNLRIVFLSGWFYPDSVGGTEIYLYSLGRELQANGCQIEIAAPSTDENERHYVYNGFSIYRYPVTTSPTRMEVQGKVSPKYLDVFTRWLDKIRPDIVHMHSVTRGCGYFHARHVKDLGIPLIVTVHTPDLTCMRGTLMRWGKIPCDGKIRIRRCGACYLHKKGLHYLTAWSAISLPQCLIDLMGSWNNKVGTVLHMKELVCTKKYMVHQLIELADHVVVLSRWQMGVLRKNGAPFSKLSLCRHGLFQKQSVKKKVHDMKPGLLRIGYVGRFDPVKGVHILIAAIKKFSSDIYIELRIYGRANNEEDSTYLKGLQNSAKNDPRIVFCGDVTDENRYEIFDDVDVLAVPSLWMETGPFVVLEAFNAGVPVIGSDLGGIAELVSDGVNGLLVEAGNIRAWASTIQRIHKQPELLEDLRDGIQDVRSIQDVCVETLRIYEKYLFVR